MGRPPEARSGQRTPLAPTTLGDVLLHRRGGLPDIPGYEILDELGRGGMGVVLRAREVRLNRIVAIKMLPPGGLTSPELISRFKGEAETIARLEHPNVVRIHAVGEHEGLPYFEMEYMVGGTLADRLDGTPWAPRKAAILVEALARGVEEVHRLGVVHRDLKPSNVLMNLDGSPKIGDFGLAKDLADDSGLTGTGVLLGSPIYMAPEQAEHGARQAGTAADVYSLGAVLYEVLTGRPPFRGATIFETLRQVRVNEPVSPSSLVPGLPRDADTITLKCLEKAPGRRYASAGELAEDLRRFLDHRPILTRRTGPAGRLLRICRRNPWQAGLVAAIVVLLLTITGVSITAAIRVAHLASQERRTFYFARMNLTQLAWESADIRRMRDLLAPYGRDLGADDLRGFEWYYWWRLAHRTSAEFAGHRGLVIAVAYSGDARTLVTAAQEGVIIAWDLATATEKARYKSARKILSLAVSSDGEKIAVGCTDGSILIWGQGDRAPRPLPRVDGKGVLALAFLDGHRLISAQDQNLDRVWDLDSWRLVREYSGPPLAAGPLPDTHYRIHAFSDDGRLMAVAGLNGTVLVRKTCCAGEATPSVVDSFRVGEVAARSLAFSADGKSLAVGGEDRSITIRDLVRRESRDKLRSHSASIWGLAFSPNSRRLAAASFDNTITLWDVETGRLEATLKGHSGPINSLAYSPDGRSIASGSNDASVKLWSMSTEGADAPVASHSAGLVVVAYSSDGQVLAAGCRDGRIVIWSASSGERIAQIDPAPENPSGHAGEVTAILYTPDGKTLISAGEHSPIRFWDAKTLTPQGSMGRSSPPGTKPKSYVSLALSSDATKLLSGCDDGEVTLWGLAERAALSTYPGRSKTLSAVAISPDGRTLAAANGGNRIDLWDAAGSRQDGGLDRAGSDFRSLAFTPDGKTLFSGDAEGRLINWDVGSKRARSVALAHTNHITSLAILDGGRTIASGARDDMIRLWDYDSGELKSTLKGHTGNVMSLAVSPDGMSLASASLDRSARIWRAATSAETRLWLGP
ncbi:protein kinase [Isosphaeraceae bacterium EP7]